MLARRFCPDVRALVTAKGQLHWGGHPRRVRLCGDLREPLLMLGRPKGDDFADTMSKRMHDAGPQALRGSFGLRHLQPPPSTLPGPGWPTDGRHPRFLLDQLRKRVRGEPILLQGDGHPRRPLGRVDDFGNIELRLADRHASARVNAGIGLPFGPRGFVGVRAGCSARTLSRMRADGLRR